MNPNYAFPSLKVVSGPTEGSHIEHYTVKTYNSKYGAAQYSDFTTQRDAEMCAQALSDVTSTHWIVVRTVTSTETVAAFGAEYL